MMGEHHKRKYKSGTSVDNPFYGGMMVPANLKERPPIEIRRDVNQNFNPNQPQQSQDDPMKSTGGYRNKNLSNLASSQIVQPTNPYTDRNQQGNSYRAV